MARRISEIEHEANRVVRQLSLKAQGEERLRRICQRRVQELEVEVLLLGKQLRSAESKFRETEKALRRAHRSSSGPYGTSAAPVPADRPQTQGKDADGFTDENILSRTFVVPAFGPLVEPSAGETN
ncbi:unnamed protein product, partial [Sphacelaria rigidula]